MVVANEIFLDFMFSQYSLIKLGRFLAFLSHFIRFLFLFFSGCIIRFLKHDMCLEPVGTENLGFCFWLPFDLWDDLHSLFMPNAIIIN